MDVFLEKCGLTETQKEVIKKKYSIPAYLFPASYEELKEKQIPDEIIKAFMTGRQAISLEDCQNVLRKDPYYSKYQ